MRELYALNLIDGWGGDWERAATVAAEVQNSVETIVAGWSGSKPSYREVEDYIPQISSEKRKPRRSGIDIDSPQALSLGKSLAGF